MYNLCNETTQIFTLGSNACELYYRRPHKRGLEHRCLPLALTIAITPAVIPAQSTVET